MEYNFKGFINSHKKYSLPFEVKDGRLRLDVSSVPYNEIHSPDSNGNYVFSSDVSFDEYLEGITDTGKIIKLHVKKYYDTDSPFFDDKCRAIGGIVSSCAVFDKEKYKNAIDKVSFYSYSLDKMLGCHVSGGLSDEALESIGFKSKLASYHENGNDYHVFHDFLNDEQFCHGQVISVKTDKPLSMDMLEDIYWTIRKFFVFMFQIKEPPIVETYLLDNNKIVGHLFIRKNKVEPKFSRKVKCLEINSWEDKLSNLFQALVDKKIYLRHLPEYGDEKHKYTPSRYLSTVVGLESSLNTLGIKADYSIEHVRAIKNVRIELQKLIESSKGKEKQEYKRLLKSTNDVRFVDKVLAAIKENKDYINNFFILSRLDENINIVAEDISKSRNHFAHGYLEEDLNIKHADQCDFMDLFILYLQLLYVGFTKKDASQTVPLAIFEH